jgi:hypothetical protein
MIEATSLTLILCLFAILSIRAEMKNGAFLAVLWIIGIIIFSKQADKENGTVIIAACFAAISVAIGCATDIARARREADAKPKIAEKKRFMISAKTRFPDGVESSTNMNVTLNGNAPTEGEMKEIAELIAASVSADRRASETLPKPSRDVVGREVFIISVTPLRD